MGKYANHPQKLGKKKGLPVFLMIVAILLAVAVAAAAWVAVKYHMVGGKLYDKDTQILDLRRGTQAQSV